MRPPSRTSYRELSLVGVMVLAISTAAFFRVPLLPEIGSELTMSAGQLGLVTSMFAFGRLLTDVPAGRLLERVRAPSLLAGSAATMALGSFAMGLAAGPVAVYAAAFVVGIASSVTNSTGMHAFSVAVPSERRGVSLAVFSTALLSGQALGPFVGGAVASASSWRVAQYVAGVVCLLILVVALAPRVRRSVQPSGGGPSDSGAMLTAAQPATRSSQRGPLLFVSFSMFFALGAMLQTLVPLIGAVDFELQVQWIGAALGMGGACRLVGGLAGGIISDRVSRRGALVPGLVLQALGIALVAGPGVAWWLGGIALMSLASWSISVSATVLADLAPVGGLGPQLGGFRFVGDAGLILGPLIATQLYQAAGKAAAVGAVASLLVAAAVWSAVSVPETGTRTTASEIS